MAVIEFPQKLYFDERRPLRVERKSTGNSLYRAFCSSDGPLTLGASPDAALKLVKITESLNLAAATPRTVSVSYVGGNEIKVDGFRSVEVLDPQALFQLQRVFRQNFFMHETKSCAYLVQPYSSSESDDVPFILKNNTLYGTVITKWLPGKDVDDLLTGGIPLYDTILLAAEAGRGLLHLHKMRIAHRDVKPNNLLCVPISDLKEELAFAERKGRGVTIDLDFSFPLQGYSCSPEAPPDVKNLLFENVEFSLGLVFGTIEYESPEQARGGALDERTDIFSYGQLVHELVTGEYLFSRRMSRNILQNYISVLPEIDVQDFLTASFGRLSPFFPPLLLNSFFFHLWETLRPKRENRGKIEPLISDLERLAMEAPSELRVRNTFPYLEQQ
ncbi:hypothetical protein J4421_06375 [Candidatus Woesearchaeota archaeon]|nr:hypothetical protein [Candidatus Woesearchaeota archaeon]HLC71638.1 hypothetical protein [Candidatus Nanoarchaeia archaeon]